jgi:predicted DCC family thiol-disulfide oxidoreductase YuxK
LVLQVLYDGGCGLCRRSRRALERLDRAGRLRFVDVHDPAEARRLFPQLRWEDLMDQMHVVDPAGRVTRGFYAFRTLASVLPALWPVWPLLHLPPVPLVGRRVYRWVARTRGRSCPDGACPLHGGAPRARPGGRA